MLSGPFAIILSLSSQHGALMAFSHFDQTELLRYALRLSRAIIDHGALGQNELGSKVPADWYWIQHCPGTHHNSPQIHSKGHDSLQWSRFYDAVWPDGLMNPCITKYCKVGRHSWLVECSRVTTAPQIPLLHTVPSPICMPCLTACMSNPTLHTSLSS